jgi:hypothetical protein
MQVKKDDDFIRLVTALVRLRKSEVMILEIYPSVVSDSRIARRYFDWLQENGFLRLDKINEANPDASKYIVMPDIKKLLANLSL